MTVLPVILLGPAVSELFLVGNNSFLSLIRVSRRGRRYKKTVPSTKRRTLVCYFKKTADAIGRGSDLTNATQNDPIRTRADLGAAVKLKVPSTAGHM